MSKQSVEHAIRFVMLVVAVLLAADLRLVSAGEYFERDGLAIGGYDPVAYFTDQKPVKGSPEFQATHRNSTFQFASSAHRDLFASDPAKFVPQYGGYCAYGMAKGYKAKIDPAAFTVVDGKLFLNYNDTVRAQWLSDISGYIRKADANWPEAMKLTKVHE
ncbi:MAG: YHS domain-containing (seleno)protein [Nitrospira sp.]|nr:YHS domain-containing (seleno)protein [Nitrospira sp.]